MGERWSQYAALPLRVVLGGPFIVLGLQTLAGAFGGAGLRVTADVLAANGLTPGLYWAWAVGLIEVLGGAAIVLGLLTRWVALVLAVESLVPVIAAAPATDVEFRLAALAAFVALALLRPQRYALDLISTKLSSWARPRTRLSGLVSVGRQGFLPPQRRRRGVLPATNHERSNPEGMHSEDGVIDPGVVHSAGLRGAPSCRAFERKGARWSGAVC